MEILEGIESRRSIRAFKPTPVPKETLEKILRAASRSPSYTNTQPWEVAVVSGKKRDELSKIILEMAKSNTPGNADLPMPKGWPPTHDQRMRDHTARRYAVLKIARDDAEGRDKLRLANYEFYGATAVIFLFMDKELGSYSIFDMGLFAQSICLAAHSMGLGTCIQAQLSNYPDAVRDFLSIPKRKALVLGISIGYEDPKALINSYRSTRAGLDEWVKWY